MAKLQSGRVDAKRAHRWAVRSTIARRKLGDWILYGIYEHLSDLATPAGTTGEPQARLYFWELAEDLKVSRNTIKRRIDRLEKMGLLKVKRATSDCSPNIFVLLTPTPRTFLTIAI
jgi:DNA-binding MarR family transcriptional regulator